MTRDTWCHTTSIAVQRPAAEAFRYMSDGLKQGEWTFGSWDREQIEADLFRGTSMFDGGTTYVRIRADADNLVIYYEVGHPDSGMSPRNMARIVPGTDLGLGENSSIVTLLAWRRDNMSEERWRQLCVSHETQMFIIRNRIEAGGGEAGSD